MNLLLSSFARALAHCLHGRVMLWSLFPLALMALLAVLLSWWLWQPAVAWTVETLQGVPWLTSVWTWLQQQGLHWGVEVLASVMVVLAATPLLVAVVLMVVSLVMTPRLVEWVAQRRFPQLERKHGGRWWQGLSWALGSTLIALLVLMLSIPLWFIPPLVLVVPPLVWGWLTYRVMAFDALAEHASQAERQEILTRYRMQLLLMGVVCGLLGAAPGVVWASGVVFVALFWLLVPVAIWIYALVFALSSLWFAHFCLAALEQMRSAGESKQARKSSPDLGAPDGQAAAHTPIA